MNRNNILMLEMIQIISIYNAVARGWTVKRLGQNSYELTIKKQSSNAWVIPTLERIINDIISYRAT